MTQQESLADQAVRVLAKLKAMNEDVTNDDADRHVLREIKRIAEERLACALRETERLIYVADNVRELRKTP